MLADISLFTSLNNATPCTVFNSDAAGTMLTFDQKMRSVELCDRYIEEMQKEEYVPAELISEMYSLREKFGADLVDLKGEIMDQASREPLDNYDRQTYLSLSSKAKEELVDVVKTDEITRRAMEMQDQEMNSMFEDRASEMSTEGAEPVKGRSEETEGDRNASEQPHNEGESVDLSKEDDYGLDVLSEE